MTSRGGFRPNGLIGRDFPLRGPYLFYHEDDINAGSGWPVRTTVGSSTNVGSLPNAGSAGSDYDLVFNMITEYSTFESLPYRTYLGRATKNTFSLGNDSTIIGELGGSIWEAGPFTAIWGLSDCSDTYFPVGTVAGDRYLNCFNQFQFYPRHTAISTTYTFDMRFDINGFHRPEVVHTGDCDVSGFAPQLSSSGFLSGETYARWDGFDFLDHFYDDFPNHLYSITIDPSLGIGDAAIRSVKVDPNNPEGDLTSTGYDLDFEIYRGTSPAPYGSTTSGYTDFIRGWANGLQMISRYDVDPGTTPVCNLVKSMGLWRGTPTQEDLVAIAAEMGL
jgi:hypothetical protein